MSEEAKPQENVVSISIAEYNQLKSESMRVKTLEQTIADEKNKYSSLNTEYETLKATKAKNGPSAEDIEREVRSKVQDELTGLQAEKGKYEAQLRKLIITDKIMGLMAGRLTPSAEKFLKYEIEKECDIEGGFDNPAIIIKDPAGNPRWSPKQMNQKMAESEYIEELETRYPDFFKSNSKPAEPNSRPSQNSPSNFNEGTVSWSQVQNMSDAELRKVDPKQLDALLSGGIPR